MAKKRILKPTEGSIIQRKDGRFMGKFKDSTGKYKYVYARDYFECLRKLNSQIAYRDRFLSDMRLYAWLDEWVKLYKEPKLKPSTLETMHILINAYIKGAAKRKDNKSVFPNKPLKDIGTMELQRFLLDIEKTRTRESVHNILSGCFAKAVATRMIDHNPMLAVEIPTQAATRRGADRRGVANLFRRAKGA